MEFRILGPLEVADNGSLVPIPAGNQRALLALLLLHANRLVPTTRAIEVLWGPEPPRTAGKMLHVYVSQLRKVLGQGVLVTQAPGYRLVVAENDLDVARFERLVRAAHDAGPAAAAGSLREALALWRGPPLADLHDAHLVTAEIARLEELRLVALEERLDADLALGRQDAVVGELRSLVREHPFRERFSCQLMLALYRRGRQADALQVYQEARRVLVDELGIEPSPELQALEKQILNQDPALLVHEAPPPEPPSPTEERPAAAVPVEPSRTRSRRRRRVLVVAAALVLAAGAAAAGAVVLLGGGGSLHALPADELGAIDPGTDHLVRAIPVGARPTRVAVGNGALWVDNFTSRTISRIDPRTGDTLATVGTQSTPSDIAVGDGSVWIANEFSGTVSRLDPRGNAIVQSLDVGTQPSAVAVGGGAVWVARRDDGVVLRIDPDTGTRRTIAVGAGPAAMAVAGGSVWVANGLDSTVTRLDAATGRVLARAIALQFQPTRIAADAGSVWVTGMLADEVSRVDPRTDSVAATVHVGDGPLGVALGDGSVWVADGYDGTVWRLDPATGAVRAKIDVGSDADALVAADGRIWVTTHSP